MFQIDCIQKSFTKNEKLFTFLIAFMPLTNVYSLPGIPLGLGEILLFVFIPFYIKREMNTSIRDYEQGFMLWFAYVVFVTLALINYFDVPLNKFISTARVAFYWILIFVFGKNFFNLDYFKKMAKIFCLSLSIFIILQSFVYASIGVYIPGILLNIPLHYGDGDGMAVLERSFLLLGYRGFIRPSGFLIEPAHCSQFLFIGLMLFITDFKLEFKIKCKAILLITAAMILTYSMTGIIMLLYAWFVFLQIEKRLSLLKWPIFIIAIMSMFMIMSGLMGVENSSIDRLLNIFTGEYVDMSSNTRLYNGFEQFQKLPLIFQFFGTGIGLFNYVSNMLEFVDSQTYMNTFSGNLFKSGFVGAIIWNFSLLLFFLKSNLLGKTLTFAFFIMSLGCSLFCQPQMVWFFLLIMADIRNKNDRYSCAKLQ